MPGTAPGSPRTPGPQVTGAVPRPPARKDIPVEEMLEMERQKAAAQPAPQASPAAGTTPGEYH